VEIAINKDTQAGPVVCKGVVKRHGVAPSGCTTGIYDSNPLLNTMVYEVEFDDGDVGLLLRTCSDRLILRALLLPCWIELWTFRRMQLWQ
jgi:hypothetical protein